MLALVLLLLTSPVLLLTMVFLAYANNGSIWFRQARPGLHEKIFTVIKFKTMTDARDAQGNLLPDEQRLTWIGKWIRKTSVDELPQLINIIRGEMSFIGPRPLLVDYLPLYNAEQKRRHEVKPGITGWAQVNGRNLLHWPDRFRLDVWYVDHLSFLLDIKILYLTFIKVLKAEGITSATAATMERFKGE